MVQIDRQKCVGCGTCAEVCPYGALYLSRAGYAAVVWSLCHPSCQECLGICEHGALTVVIASPPSDCLTHNAGATALL